VTGPGSPKSKQRLGYMRRRFRSELKLPMTRNEMKGRGLLKPNSSIRGFEVNPISLPHQVVQREEA